jgi:hypothetical protein
VNARKHLAIALGFAALLIACLAPAAAQASFGINSFEASARNQNGSVDLQAGSHPYEYTLAFKLNADAEGNPEGFIRDIVIDLPPGMVGNPLATPRCPLAEFEGATPQCPGNSQVGVVRVGFIGETLTLPIYSLAPPLGVPARFGFTLFGFNGFQEASLRTGSDYGVTVSDITVPHLAIRSVVASIWGVPAEASHDPERFCPKEGGLPQGCSSEAGAPLAPFFSLPTSCGGPLKTTISADSVEEPGVFQSESVFSFGENGHEAGLSNCEAPPFEPQLVAQPETTVSDSPTGLHVNLHLRQNQNPNSLATANLKDTVLTLPAGMAVNPSAADGLAACSSAEVDLSGPGPANCPAASKMGTVEVRTPLLDHPVPGAVYLAKQGDNPFGSLIALYIAVDDPISGVVVKLAGRVEPDPLTGQLHTTFLNNPQLPFEDLSVDFPGGPRAALTTPSTCGGYTTETVLTPWTAPEGKDATPSDSFPIATAPGGGACPASEAQMPNKPSFEAGTATPLAGAYAPFVLKLSRENGSQRLGALNVTLPPGLSAKLAGVQECSEAQIAGAESRRNPGEGALEKASPSCPAASELGTVNVGAGSGNPLYVQGHAYLAGPYKGAPLSMAIITPAVAGPFDLGTVVVRAALYVNEVTAQVTVKSDPIPRILQGIPLDVRSIAVQIDRSQFTLNPTSCEAKAVTGEAISTTGAVAALSNRFQVGACNALGFKPGVTIDLKGGTKRNQNPALTATVTYPKGSYANIARAAVTLPHSEFLDQAHIGTVCTRVQFAARACPAASVYGHANAITPLLANPLEGPVYLRSSSHELPDLVAELNGQIRVVLDGRVDTGKGAGIRNTFEGVPDAPVSKFVLKMKGGNKGLLVNSENICGPRAKRDATVKLTAQNGKVHNFSQLVSNSCGKSGK